MTIERMRTCLFVFLLMVALHSTAQSFESLKRSKGKTELYTAVEQTLSGQMSVAQCKTIIETSNSLTDPYQGKTPIYLVLDYLATHPQSKCGIAEKVLDAFLARPDFDVNLRYSSLLPPLPYLIRENHRFLNGKYSKDYISDHVFQAMIIKGAKVNTYAEDGSTLMAFAIETGNEGLKSFFSNQGLDAHHEDSRGHDDVYKLIEKGDLKHLKQLVDNNTPLNINLLKNDPKSFARYPELYDYVARHCAVQARSYEDVTLFRKRFSDRRSLVNDKYEGLCRQECQAASDYFQIMKCLARYPDLSAITTPRKQTIYRRDCKAIDDIFVKVCIVAAPLDLYERFPQEDKVAYFLKAYGSGNYDPDHFLPKARDVENLYAISKAVHWSPRRYFDDYWYQGRFNVDKRVVEDGLNAARQSSSSGLKSYFSKAASFLQEKYNYMLDRKEREYARYLEYENRRSQNYSSGGWSSSGSSSSQSGVDVEKIRISDFSYEVDDEWYSSIGDDILDRYRKEVRFKDNDGSLKGYIFIDDKKRYPPYIDASSSYSYDSWNNLIIALYAYKKYGKMRKTGRK